MRTLLYKLGLRKKPSMDVLIVGVPRSGTSMLSNLMTSFPDTLILYEPHLGLRRPSSYVLNQMEELGLLHDFGSNRELVRYVADNVGRWGIKEVMIRHIKAAVRLYDLEKVVFVVRNIHHVALSIYDKGWRPQPTATSAAALVDLYGRCEPERRTVVRYETFVTDEAYQIRVAEDLSWPLEGNPSVGLEKQGREGEVNRHQRKVTARSLELRESERDPKKLAFASELVAQCTAYQNLFGYPTEVT